MLRPIVVFAALAYCGLAAEAVREVTAPSLSNLVPGFYQGHYYWHSDPDESATTVYGPDGLLSFHYQAHNDGRIQGVGFDTDGTAAVAWWSPAGSGIDLVNTAGSLVKTVKTGLFMPGHCGFAEDHSLWCSGTQLASLGPSTVPAKGGYMTVRHYLQDRTEAGAYLSRATFPTPGTPPDYWSWQRPSITVTHDRVGLWLRSDAKSTHSEWVELDLNGNLVGRWPVLGGAGMASKCVAMTADDHVYMESKRTLYMLDRASSTWRPVSGPSNPHAELIGAAGNQLVFLGYWPDQSVHFYWYDQPES